MISYCGGAEGFGLTTWASSGKLVEAGGDAAAVSGMKLVETSIPFELVTETGPTFVSTRGDAARGSRPTGFAGRLGAGI
jgi:hypothetical protein